MNYFDAIDLCKLLRFFSLPHPRASIASLHGNLRENTRNRMKQAALVINERSFSSSAKVRLVKGGGEVEGLGGRQRVGDERKRRRVVGLQKKVWSAFKDTMSISCLFFLDKRPPVTSGWTEQLQEE